ncbi:Iron-sulfur cluster carrier protein [Metallosphaera sp. J1]|nr:Iron-sulfur cluster carrier protein [Metallosphaera javensis (ex Hofmann et al. 2022)]
MIRIAVIGAKGGVGKSTVAYGIAKTLSSKYKVSIIDVSSSRTICNIHGIRGSLEDGHDYMVDQGNLKIVSMSSQLSSSFNLSKIKDTYDEIISDTDYLIVDYGVHIYDKVVSGEILAFYDERTDPTHIIAVSSPQEFVVMSTEKMVESYIELVKTSNDSARGVLDYIVINMVREKGNFRINIKPTLGMLVIPFYRDLSFNGFWNADIPREVIDMANTIENRVR